MTAISPATAAPISPTRAIFDIPTLSGVRISPDGTQLLWTRMQASTATWSNVSQIWRANIDGTDARAITSLGSNSEAIWSPDGTAIAYVSKRDGDRPFAIVTLPLAGGEPRVITTHAYAPTQLAWSPDGTTIAYAKMVDPENPNETPRDPKTPPAVRVVTRVDYKQDGIGFINDVRFHIFTVDVATGSRTQLTHELVDHVDPVWSPDGATLAIVLPTDHGMRSAFGLIDIATGELTIHGDDTGLCGTPSWSPDGSLIAFTGQQFALPNPDVTLFEPATGAFRKVIANPDFLADGLPSSGGAPVWLDATHLAVHGVFHGKSGIWTVDITTNEVSEVGIWPALHGYLSGHAASGTLAQVATSIDGLVGIVTIDIATSARTVVHDEGAAIFGETPAAQWEEVSIERNGFTIEGWLYKPADFDPAKTYPLILDIHGGPHLHFNFSFNYRVQMLATNGFLVLVINPRGSTGYGRDFALAVRGDWGGEDWLDLQALLDDVVVRPYVDAERTGITGYSYGGYMTSWAIGHTDRFKAAIVGSPCFDLESFFSTSDIGYHFGVTQHETTPWEDRAKLAAQSPSTFIQNATTPTLIAHGEADERCPIGQGEQLFISLKKLGVETVFARYPGVFHLFLNPGGHPHLRLDYYERSLAWLKDHLGDPV